MRISKVAGWLIFVLLALITVNLSAQLIKAKQIRGDGTAGHVLTSTGSPDSVAYWGAGGGGVATTRVDTLGKSTPYYTATALADSFLRRYAKAESARIADSTAGGATRVWGWTLARMNETLGTRPCTTEARVHKLIGGSNISVSPSNGQGDVTVGLTGGISSTNADTVGHWFYVIGGDTFATKGHRWVVDNDTVIFVGGTNHSIFAIPYWNTNCPDMSSWPNGSIMACAGGVSYKTASGQHSLIRADSTNLFLLMQRFSGVDAWPRIQFRGDNLPETLWTGIYTTRNGSPKAFLLTNGYFYTVSIHPDSLWGRDSTWWAGVGGGVTSIAKSGETPLTGAVTFTGSGSTTLTQAGQNIEISSTGGGGGGDTAKVVKETGATAYATTKQDTFKVLGNAEVVYSPGDTGRATLSRTASGGNVKAIRTVDIPQGGGMDSTLGKALQFDATGSMFVRVDSTSADLDFVNKFSAECWYKAPNQSFSGWIMGSCQTFYNDWSIGNYYGTGYSGCYPTMMSTPLPTDGNWHMVDMTWDHSKLRLYVDGAKVDSVAYSTTRSVTTHGVYIGRRTDGFLGFNGSVDEVFLTNDVIPLDTIIAHYNGGHGKYLHRGAGGSGISGIYHLDEGTGTFTADSSGNGFDGTLSGGPSWVTGKVWDVHGTPQGAKSAVKVWSLQSPPVNSGYSGWGIFGDSLGLTQVKGKTIQLLTKDTSRVTIDSTGQVLVSRGANPDTFKFTNTKILGDTADIHTLLSHSPWRVWANMDGKSDTLAIISDGSKQKPWAWLIWGRPWEYASRKAEAVAGSPEDRFTTLFERQESLEVRVKTLERRVQYLRRRNITLTRRIEAQEKK